MKYKLQDGRFLALFSLMLFTFAMVNVANAALVDLDTVEVLYLFDEGEGEVALDSSANGRDGSIIGAQYVEGVFGSGINYDGTDDNLIVTGYTGIGGTEPRSTLFWFKASSTREHSWVKWGPNAAGQKYYIRAHVSGAQCFLRVEVNGGQNYGTTDVCDGDWHHLAMIFPDGADSVQDHDLYVDGVLQEKVGNDRDMDTNVEAQEINIGARLTGHAFLHGAMDELAIFSAALDADQINAILEVGMMGTVSVDPIGKLATSWSRIKQY